MKTPEKQRQDQVHEQSKAKRFSEIRNSEDLKFCEILLDDCSRQGKVEIKFHYKNEGKIGRFYHRGVLCKQEFSVERVSNILCESGWTVYDVPDQETRESNCLDYGDKKIDLPTGTVEVHFPNDVEVGIAPVEKGVIRPSEYLAILQNNLNPVLVEIEIGNLCDSELKAKRKFEVVLTPYWKVRQYIFVPHVRKHGWVVEVSSDKIVIRYPEDTETAD